MRDLAKYAFNLSWALTLVGVDQVVNLVKPTQKSKGDVSAPITQVAANTVGIHLVRAPLQPTAEEADRKRPLLPHLMASGLTQILRRGCACPEVPEVKGRSGSGSEAPRS